MKILVVDDYPQNRELLLMILEDEGHSCVEAADGIQACELFRADMDINLILMDVNMPLMDGITATRVIKQESEERFVPIIFVTALDNTEILVRCLDAGGDDFVPKPVNETVLMAKIDAHARAQTLYVTLQDAHKSLRYHQQVMNREHAIVEHIFANSSRRNKTFCENIQHYTSPVSMFDGDVVLSGPSPAGGNYLMVGDFTGHGLAAAIGSLPVTEIFYSLTERQASISQLAEDLNERLTELLPTSMFCCATLLFIDASGTQCTVWSGGMNDVLRVKPGTGSVAKVAAQHMPLGILSKSEFDNTPQLFEIDAGERLYIYTDGVNEAVNPQGEEFGLERLERLVAAGGDNVVAKITASVKDFHRDSGQSDDLSIVELTGGPLVHRRTSDSSVVDVRSEFHRAHSFPWHLHMRLEDEDLRNVNIVDEILGFVASIRGIELHQDKIFTIVSELYSNSLEHGVLGLASDLKDTPAGFETYYRERQERLAAVSGQFIELDFSYIRGATNRVQLVITDSGEGFDIDKTLTRCADDDTPFGRGINLLHSLCSRLEYSLGGRSVTAVYDLCI
ncbi:ATP-binding SpoIIE family protein phosphatase [Teredinibacter turnerae]|uniref:ATP-binding SpoIIE family protein phosphatase n=1 Tax=Teredinibacter turnerae TaxID=2426 RepID=UPI0003717C63|nr:fused response regulator/phosphatase [Teredinibacter turnerae]